MEVGTEVGNSLRVARCASLAIDPNFRLKEGVIGRKPVCVLHQSTSDEFFARHDPIEILGGPVDFAFLDGLHVFEFILRDFIGTEPSCLAGSLIALDDCCPRDHYMTRPTLYPEYPQPTRYPGFWTGDVWKMVPVLREYRPGMSFVTLDAQPTGMVVCSNLDPDDRTLSENYAEIVERWAGVDLRDYGMAQLFDDCQMTAAEAWVSALAPIGPEYPE